MLTVIVVAAILSIQLVSVNSGTVQKCLEGNHHKKFPSIEGKPFATCLPWQNKSTCCTAETTVDLKKSGVKHLFHFDWDYCGVVSGPCRKYLLGEACFYYCDPNVVNWRTERALMSKLPICSDTCDKWFEACKNDKTYSDDWLEDFALYRNTKGPIKPKRPCRTFAEIYRNGEGLCNELYGPAYKYERSSNCVVFDFEGENPNNKVVPDP